MISVDLNTYGSLEQCNCGQCAFGQCRKRWQQGPSDYQRYFQQLPVPTITVAAPEIDYERLADLIAERLQRPKGYQG